MNDMEKWESHPLHQSFLFLTNLGKMSILLADGSSLTHFQLLVGTVLHEKGPSPNLLQIWLIFNIFKEFIAKFHLTIILDL